MLWKTRPLHLKKGQKEVEALRHVKMVCKCPSRVPPEQKLL